jgi:hypothetical protein
MFGPAALPVGEEGDPNTVGVTMVNPCPTKSAETAKSASVAGPVLVTAVGPQVSVITSVVESEGELQ